MALDEPEISPRELDTRFTDILLPRRNAFDDRADWRRSPLGIWLSKNWSQTCRTHWYVVPADDKENARLIVSQIILDTLEGLKMIYPRTSAKRRRELQLIRKQLTK